MDQARVSPRLRLQAALSEDPPRIEPARAEIEIESKSIAFGLRVVPRARVGVAASSAAVQPLPAARALRDGGPDGRAAAAAAPSLIDIVCAHKGKNIYRLPLTSPPPTLTT